MAAWGESYYDFIVNWCKRYDLQAFKIQHDKGYGYAEYIINNHKIILERKCETPPQTIVVDNSIGENHLLPNICNFYLNNHPISSLLFYRLMTFFEHEYFIGDDVQALKVLWDKLDE